MNEDLFAFLAFPENGITKITQKSCILTILQHTEQSFGKSQQKIQARTIE